MIYVKLSRSEKPTKKFKVKIASQRRSRGIKTIFDRPTVVHFGAKGMSDFTKNKDVARKQRYISRHKARENWGISGVLTAGFWSRWLLWNQTSILESKRDIQKRFNIIFS